MSSKETYQQEMQAKLEQLHTELNELEERAPGLAGDSRPGDGKGLRELKLKYQEAEAKLGELRRATEDSWERLKVGIEIIWHELGESIADVRDGRK